MSEAERTSEAAERRPYGAGLRHPVEITHDHYQQLFNEARHNRNEIRGTLATPVAAAAFSVFNLGTLATYFDVGQLWEPVGTTIALLGCAAVLAVLGAVFFMVRVEWHFVHLEPPDLPEIARISEKIRAAHAEIEDEALVASTVSAELQNVLTGSYYVGYEDLLIGNARSASARTWALRLVLAALTCLSIAFLLLPFHRAGGAGAG